MKATKEMARVFIRSLYDEESDPRSDEAVLRALQKTLADIPDPQLALDRAALHELLQGRQRRINELEGRISELLVARKPSQEELEMSRRIGRAQAVLSGEEEA